MIDPVALQRLHTIIPEGEDVIWAGRPSFNIFSIYSLMLLGFGVFVILTSLFQFWIDPEPLQVLARNRVVFVLIVFVWFALFYAWLSKIFRPLKDAYVVTDIAFYIVREIWGRSRSLRIPHIYITAVTRLFGLRDCLTLAYKHVGKAPNIFKRVSDISLYGYDAIHIRDVADMDDLLRLLQDKGNQHSKVLPEQN